jgi:hypothetical protein
MQMVIDDVELLIRATPGMTASQIATTLFGENGYGERAGMYCLYLWRFGRIERRGKGGPGNPFRYYSRPSSEDLSPTSISEIRTLQDSN